MPKGSVVVVAHNSGGCLEACLQALSAEFNWEILLIDNASLDQSLEQAARFGERVRVVANAENRGFAAAVNQGVHLTTCPVIVVVNPDVVPERGALDRLAESLAESDIGVAGGMLLDASGRPQRGFVVRLFPSLGSILCEVLLVNRFWRSNPWNSRYRCLDMDYSQVQAVDQPAGAALAFRREAWEKAGGLDEDFYPVWFEDVDFCLRLRRLGWRIMYCPQAMFRHTGGHSVNRLSLWERQSYWYANLLRYFRKHHGRGAVALLRLGIAAGMVLRALATLFGGARDRFRRFETVGVYARVLWRYAIRGASPVRPSLPLLAGSSGVRR